ncbi:MAG: amidohydrolase family protein [Gemmataceae bacterium]
MKPILVRADRCFDGAATSSNVTLQIENGRIAQVHKEAPPQGEVIEFPGCTLLPGLIDTHVHLVFCAADTHQAVIAQVEGESDDELLARAERNARAALRTGITTLRDCGGRNRVVQTLRDRINKGYVEGPEVLACGMPITTLLGHCHWLGLRAETNDEVVRAAERMLKEDADFLKVMATGGNMTRTSDPLVAQYDADAITLIADIGRQAHRHTAAHVLSRAGLPATVAARVRTIEHCDWRVEVNRYEFDAELAARIRNQDQYVGLTMSGTARRAFHPEVAKFNPQVAARLDARFECERRMIETGIRYTIHSDAGVGLTPIDRFAEGLHTALIELKLSPAEVLAAATRTAALAIGFDDRGQLAPGKRADLLVVAGDPFVDFAALEQVRAVMKAGQWIDLD